MPRRKRTDQFTRLELEIMQVLWETSPASTQTVQQKLSAERPLAYTTVQTMLNVLLRKQKVKRTLSSRTYLYRPSVSKLQAVRQAMGDVIDRLFGGSPESLVLSLVETKQLKPEQLEELHKLVSAREERDAHS